MEAEVHFTDTAPPPTAGDEAATLPTEPEIQDVQLEPLESSATSAPPALHAGDLVLVLDVPVELAVEIGRTTIKLRDALAIGPGSIVALDRRAGEPVDLLVNGKRVARGEVIVIDEEFGLRVTEVVSPDSNGHSG